MTNETSLSVDRIRDLVELVMTGEPVGQFTSTLKLVIEIMDMTGLPVSLLLVDYIHHVLAEWSRMRTTPNWLAVNIGPDASGVADVGLYRLSF